MSLLLYWVIYKWFKKTNLVCMRRLITLTAPGTVLIFATNPRLDACCLGRVCLPISIPHSSKWGANLLNLWPRTHCALVETFDWSTRGPEIDPRRWWQSQNFGHFPQIFPHGNFFPYYQHFHSPEAGSEIQFNFEFHNLFQEWNIYEMLLFYYHKHCFSIINLSLNLEFSPWRRLLLVPRSFAFWSWRFLLSIKGILWDRRWIAPSIGIFPLTCGFFYRNAWN